MVAPEVSVVLKVDLEPDTERGSLLRLAEKPPPERADSAARESEAMGPGPSCLGWREAAGSVVFCGIGEKNLVWGLRRKEERWACY